MKQIVQTQMPLPILTDRLRKYSLSDCALYSPLPDPFVEMDIPKSALIAYSNSYIGE